MPQAPIRRCAVYTRTSSDEGLLQDYNSLAAQRDACAAYIASQRHEGWVRVRRSYDDGGFSGGSLDRPALRMLLADLVAGEIDIVVIYKIDRLTRSLRDFARLSEILDRHGASFVAVTQQFNTASSMGRLTLNVLLTFAQFEREVAGDRIRDKIASSTRLGIWMGGNPALGYDASAKKLVVNPREAEIVRHIFRRFVELRSMAKLRQELEQSGIVSKRRVLKDGCDYGGRNFSWHPLRKILSNPLYKGMVRHKDQLYRGRHEAIIEEALFDEVQVLLTQTAASENARRALAYPSLLRGILFDTAGDRLYPRHTQRRTGRYQYYISRSLASKKIDRASGTQIRVSAPALEHYVVGVLARHLRDRRWLDANVPTIRRLQSTRHSAEDLAGELEQQLVRNTGLLPQLVSRVEMDRITLRLMLNRAWLMERLAIRLPRGSAPIANSPIAITVDGHQLRCGLPLRIVMENPEALPEPDRRLVHEVLRAIRWFDALSSGVFPTTQDLAKAEGCCPALISDRIRLAFLAPDIVEAILQGKQPRSLTVARLKRACPLPLSWEEQRTRLLGAPSAKPCKADAYVCR